MGWEGVGKISFDREIDRLKMGGVRGGANFI